MFLFIHVYVLSGVLSTNDSVIVFNEVYIIKFRLRVLRTRNGGDLRLHNVIYIILNM